MAYTTTNYPTRKALAEDLKAGKIIHVYQPGPFGPDVRDGIEVFEGPHYPKPHRWYARGEVRNGILVRLLK